MHRNSNAVGIFDVMIALQRDSIAPQAVLFRLFGVPPTHPGIMMFFNIFINDFSLQIAKVDICDYADDTALFTSDRI